jgi:hypothetical protein
MTTKAKPYTFNAGLLRKKVEEEEQPLPLPPQGKRAGPVAPSRVGKRAVTFYCAPEAWAQLKMLAIRHEGASTQSLMEEAMNDLFSKHGMNRFD